MTEHVESALARGGHREAVAGLDVLDEDEQLVAIDIPEERYVNVVVPSMCQLGHEENIPHRGRRASWASRRLAVRLALPFTG